MFVPPINLGQFQPSPATLADWIYQIWNYLQNNPIATQEQLQEYIATFITTSPETQTIIGEGVEQYLTDNPPQAPVQSVQGKTGAVSLTYPDIVPASNAVPVYRAASAPNVSTAQGLYNNGYRLFANTATQELFTISNSGALTLVGRGKFDGTTIDLNSTEGDTTIAEAIEALETAVDGIVVSGTWTPTVSRANVTSAVGKWTKAGKVGILKGVIIFSESTNQGNIFINGSSLPFSTNDNGLGGAGRIPETDQNVVLSTTDGNNNVWIGLSTGITGEAVSNRRLVFTLMCIAA